MKYTKNILGTMLLTAVVTASCVDDKPLAFEVEKPLLQGWSISTTMMY